MKYQSVDEWKARGKELYGEDVENWKFVCPSCDKVSSGADFKVTGAELENMYNTCIGRHNNKETGCDWAAYGLFKTMGKGDVVITPDGKEVDVFAFAEIKLVSEMS